MEPEKCTKGDFTIEEFKKVFQELFWGKELKKQKEKEMKNIKEGEEQCSHRLKQD